MPHFDVGGVTRIHVPEGGPTAPQAMSDDGYPAVITDQSNGYEGHVFTKAEEVVVFWEEFLSRQRPPKRPIKADHSVAPYINHSRWLADCDCGGGMLCWDRNPYACCLTCGTFYEVDWPAPQVRAEAVRLIATRNVVNRNWDHHKGETAQELMAQNILMEGIQPKRVNGLLMAGDLELPDDLANVNDYLDRLRTERAKKEGA